MIIDDTIVFSDGQAITADADSTNAIDLGASGTAFGHAAAVPRDIGKSGNAALAITVTEAFDNLTSLEIQIRVDDNAAFSSAKVVARSRAIPLSELTLGARLPDLPMIPEGADERYMRLYYDVTGTAPTAGKLFAAIVAGRQTN